MEHFSPRLPVAMSDLFPDGVLQIVQFLRITVVLTLLVLTCAIPTIRCQKGFEGEEGTERVTQCACLVFNFILGLPKWGWLGACLEGCRHSVSCQDHPLSITPPLMSAFNLQSGRRFFQSAHWGPSTDDDSRRKEKSWPLNHPANHTAPEEKAVIVTRCLVPEEKTVIVTYEWLGGVESSRWSPNPNCRNSRSHRTSDKQLPDDQQQIEEQIDSCCSIRKPRGSREATNKALFSPETWIH